MQASLSSGTRPRMAPRARREAIVGYLFILPWLAGLLIFTLGPIVASLYLSMTNYEVVRAPEFNGLSNYEFLFKDRLFWQALRVTTLYVFISVPLGLVLSFAVAMLMNQKL